MLAIIYITYSMMALYMECFKPIEDTWIECLGDLGRYRMAIDIQDAGPKCTHTTPCGWNYSSCFTCKLNAMNRFQPKIFKHDSRILGLSVLEIFADIEKE